LETEGDIDEIVELYETYLHSDIFTKEPNVTEVDGEGSMDIIYDAIREDGALNIAIDGSKEGNTIQEFKLLKGILESNKARCHVKY